MAYSRPISFIVGLAVGGVVGFIGFFGVTMGVGAVMLPIFHLFGADTLNSGPDQRVIMWWSYGIYDAIAICLFSILLPLDFFSGFFISLPLFSIIVISSFAKT
jgi:hypothetical protein